MKGNALSITQHAREEECSLSRAKQTVRVSEKMLPAAVIVLPICFSEVCRCCKKPSTENESQEIEMAGQQGNQTPSELQSEWDGSERDATEPAEEPKKVEKVNSQSDHRKLGVQWKLIPASSPQDGGGMPLYVRQKH